MMGNMTIDMTNMTQRDRDLLTSYYRHWNLIDEAMECIGYRDGKPVFRPILQEVLSDPAT